MPISQLKPISEGSEENETNVDLINDFSFKLKHPLVDFALKIQFRFQCCIKFYIPFSSANVHFSNGKILPSRSNKEEIKIPCLDLPLPH